MKKEYISPSIQVLQIESENILSGSMDTSTFDGMNGLPSDPRNSYFYEDDEY